MTTRQQELIALFLSDSLTQEDQREMEALLETDKPFRADFASLNLALYREASLRRWAKHKPQPWWKRSKRLLWVICAVLGLLMLAYWKFKPLLWPDKPPEPVLMAMDRYTPATNFTLMGSNTTDLSEIEVIFQKKDAAKSDYDKSLDILRGLPDKAVLPEDSIKYRLFEGISLLRSSKPDYQAAELIFTKIIAQKKGNTAEPLWFLALAHANQKEWAECEAALEQIDPSWNNTIERKALLNHAKNARRGEN